MSVLWVHIEVISWGCMLQRLLNTLKRLRYTSICPQFCNILEARLKLLDSLNVTGYLLIWTLLQVSGIKNKWPHEEYTGRSVEMLALNLKRMNKALTMYKNYLCLELCNLRVCMSPGPLPLNMRFIFMQKLFKHHREGLMCMCEKSTLYLMLTRIVWTPSSPGHFQLLHKKMSIWKITSRENHDRTVIRMHERSANLRLVHVSANMFYRAISIWNLCRRMDRSSLLL